MKRRAILPPTDVGGVPVEESGPVEVYVRPFRTGGKWQVSMAGGNSRGGDPTGRKLFYVAPMAADGSVDRSGGRQADGETSPPVPLFATRSPRPVLLVWSRKPAVCGRARWPFLMNVAVEGTTASPITIVLNWDTGLKNEPRVGSAVPPLRREAREAARSGLLPKVAKR